MRPVAMALRTARPRAEAICIDTLTMPDPRPASATGTSAMAIDSSGAKAVPAPSPMSRNAGSITDDVGRVGAERGQQQQPDACPHTMPGMSTRLSPNRVTSRAVIPADRIPMVTDIGQEGEAGLDRACSPSTPSR